MKNIFATLLLAGLLQIPVAHADEPPFTISGTMVHTNLEGGCWYLEAPNGDHYELIGDSEVINQLHEEGKQVSLTVRSAPGRASICMVGYIVEVVDQVVEQRHPIDLVIAPMKLDGRMHYKSGMWYVRTKEGARFEFRNTPAKKYRKENARINTTMRVLLDTKSTKLHMDGVILPPPRPPVVTTGKNIPKKYDPR